MVLGIYENIGMFCDFCNMRIVAGCIGANLYVAICFFYKLVNAG